jgi:hypothetical protein
VAAAAALAAAASGAAGPGSFVISASPPSLRLGAYQVDRNPAFAGARSALAHPSACRLVGGDPSHARAVWSALGVVIELRTYGALPAGATGCTAAGRIWVHTVRAAGRRWTTSRGLHIGDSVDELRQRYPSAKPAHALPGWYAGGYWLVTRHVGGYEGIGGFKPSAPVLVAEMRDGRVTAFVLVVDGEGD